MSPGYTFVVDFSMENAVEKQTYLITEKHIERYRVSEQFIKSRLELGITMC